MFVPDIIERFQRLLGKGIIKGIRVKIGPVSIKSEGRLLSTKEYSLTEDEQKLIHDCTDTLRDPAFAEGFSKLIRTFYQNQKKVLMNWASCSL